MEILATLAFMLGFALVLARFMKKDTQHAEAETQDRYIDLIRRDIEADGSMSPEDKEKGKKKAKRSPTVDAVSAKFATYKFLREGEGRTMMEKLNEQLIVAGIRDKYTPFDALAIATIIWTIGILGPTIVMFTVGLSKLIYVVMVGVFAYYPFGKMKSLTMNRKDSLKMELPVFIQQLSMALSSGMTTLDDAIKRVVANAEIDPYDSALAREFGRAHTEYTLARIDRDVALRGISKRTQVVAVENLVEAIIQGLRTGTDMSIVLDEYAEQAREMWRQDVRTFKAKKEPLVTMGMVVTMFGGFILLATPMMINLGRTISGI